MSAAIDEWNNHRPRNNKGKLMSMAMFCKHRDIPRATFEWHNMSIEKKEAARKKKRQDSAKRRAAMSDEMKETARKKRSRAAMSDKTREAIRKKEKEQKKQKEN